MNPSILLWQHDRDDWFHVAARAAHRFQLDLLGPAIIVTDQERESDDSTASAFGCSPENPDNVPKTALLIL